MEKKIKNIHIIIEFENGETREVISHPKIKIFSLNSHTEAGKLILSEELEPVIIKEKVK